MFVVAVAVHCDECDVWLFIKNGAIFHSLHYIHKILFLILYVILYYYFGSIFYELYAFIILTSNLVLGINVILMSTLLNYYNYGYITYVHVFGNVPIPMTAWTRINAAMLGFLHFSGNTTIHI